jgi:hypothetical protein
MNKIDVTTELKEISHFGSYIGTTGQTLVI